MYVCTYIHVLSYKYIIISICLSIFKIIHLIKITFFKNYID